MPRACAPRSRRSWSERKRMSEAFRTAAGEDRARWPGWCCSYCAAPLQEDAHGMICAPEGRWFATQQGVHRLVDPGAAARAAARPGGLPTGWPGRGGAGEAGAVPLEPASMDLVLAAGVLHHAARPARTLVEMRRVTRRGGLVAVLDSPVYRRAVDGETMVAERAEEHSRRYGFAAVPFGQGYLRWSELPALFEGAGWRLEVHGWPGRAREITRDLVEIARWGRRTARFPILIGRRDG